LSTLVLEQSLNGLQFSVVLFLIASGLTLIFGVMNFVNLAHGSFFMIGAYLAAWISGVTGSFWLGVAGALPLAALIGVVLERLVFRRLYHRDHMVHVLATFAFILIFNDLVRIVWGPLPLALNAPPALAGAVPIFGVPYSSYRLVVMAVGVAVGLLLFFLVTRTRIGMRVRAGASDRPMAELMGVRVGRIFNGVFLLGAALAALAGALMGPIVAVQVGMGEAILIPALVVLVIGGIGSVRGAFVAALLVGVVDTIGRAFVPMLLRATLPPATAADLGPLFAEVAMYALMVVVLIFRPSGLFSARS
jgi:branched-chain amino acid transport system permease protein